MSLSCKLASTSLLAVLLAACTQSTPAPAPSTEAGPTPSTGAVAPPSSPAEPSPAEPEATRMLTPADLQVARTASLDSCNIEAIGSAVFATATGPIEVTEKATTVGGWVLSSASKKSGVPAHLKIVNAAGDAGAQVRITQWNPRPDVMTAMGAVDSGDIGFVQAVDLSMLPAGEYQVSVAFEDGGEAYSCEKGRMIVLK